MKRVKIVHTPDQHGTGKDSPRCTCKGKTGDLVAVFTDGVAIVNLDAGGRVGLPFSCLRELQ
jgi:hypothetical protein